MSLSPYRNQDASVYRGRSSSLSSPNSQNFLYQEVFEIGGNALVRSFSCGRVFGKDQTGRTIQSTRVQVTNFVSPVKSLVKLESDRMAWSTPKKKPIRNGSKPLKAKLALQFHEKNGEMIVDGNNSKGFGYLIWRNIKRTIYINLFILTILSASCIYYHCNLHWDTQDIINKLKESVFGQELAVLNIEKVFNRFNESQNSAVMCFTGSVGVGKTFVSSVIYKNFPWLSNEYIDFFDSNTEEILRTKKHSFCGINLIVIDGIHFSVAESALKSVNHLIDNNSWRRFMVILIFKTRNEDEEKFVLNQMKKTDEKFWHIPFRELNREEIENCFIAELKRQNKVISPEKLDDLLNEQMKFCNLSKSFPGCKNVFHEVSRLPEID